MPWLCRIRVTSATDHVAEIRNLIDVRKFQRQKIIGGYLITFGGSAIRHDDGVVEF